MSYVERLGLYALYQQVVVGDAPTKLPPGGRWTHLLSDRLRYTAWTKLRGMKTETAIGLYTLAVSKASGGMMGPKTVSRPQMMAAPSEDTNNTSLEGQLLQAASMNDRERVSQLLNDNATINISYQDSTGQTALLLAANTGSVELVRLLLEHARGKSLLDITDQDGISVLQTAVAAGHVDVCRVLLTEYGADPDQEDNDGDTPRSSAESDGCSEMQQLFAQFSVL